MADQMELLREQVKMLVGEVALLTSSLRRLSEQATTNPDDYQLQVELHLSNCRVFFPLYSLYLCSTKVSSETWHNAVTDKEIEG